MTTDIILGDVAPPAPGEYFTSQVLHPDNVALAVRMAGKKPLTRKQLKRVLRERDRLHKTLEAQEFFALLDQYQQQRETYSDLLEQYRDIYAQGLYARQHDPEKLRAIVPDLKATRAGLAPLKRQVGAVRTAMQPYMADYKRYQQLTRLIETNEIRRAEYKANQQIERGLEDEARLLAKILREVWGAHRKTHYKVTLRHNKKRKVVPRIESIDIEATSVWLKIQVGKKGFFGYRYSLPTDVHVADLVSDEIMQDYSRAVRRGIEVVDLPSGTFVVVNRLDSPGGIAERVLYRVVMRGFYPKDERHRYPYPAGIAPGNRIVWLDFSRWNHILVGGFTGGGKSNFMNVVISTLISAHPPSEARFVFIDLKRNEFNLYEGIPHLLVDPVYTPQDANHVLHQMIELMEERYELMQAYRVKKIDDYNRVVPEASRLPRIFIMIDEAGELTGYRDLTVEVHHAMGRLTALGRAAGVHCVICTQRPEVAVVPGRVKANCSVRVSFRSADYESSKVILGVGAARELPAIVGRAVLLNSPDPVTIQTPYITDDDVLEAVEIAKSWGAAPDVEMPDASDYKQLVLTEAALIELVYNQLDGRWALGRTWDYLKANPQYQVKQKEMREMMQLVERKFQRGPIEVGGIVYKLKSLSGRNRQLIAEFPDLEVSEIQAPDDSEENEEETLWF